MMTLDKYFSTVKTLTDSKPAATNGEKELYGYKLPKEWKIVTLCEIFRVVNKNTRKIRIEPDKVYKLIVTRLYARGVELKELKKGSQIKAKYMYVVKEGDFIFSKINVKKGALGFIPPELDGAVVTAEHPILRFDERKVNKKFVFYYLSQPFIWNEFKRRSKGFADKSRTKINEFLEVKIALPPLEEQHKIVYVLDTIKHAIEVQDRLLDTLNELKRALMNRLFTKGLDPNKPTKLTEIGEIPAHWEVKKLLEISTIIMGNSPPGKSYNVNGEGIPLINGPSEFGNIYPKKIKFTTKPTKLTRPGDILITVRATVGKVNFTDDVYCIGRGVAAIRVNKNIVLPEYLYYFLQYSEEKIRLIAKPHGTTFPQITKSQLSQLKIPLPPFNEQSKISNILTKIDNRIKLTYRKKNLLEELFNVMLHKLMTGQIRVANLNEVYPSRKLPGV